MSIHRHTRLGELNSFLEHYTVPAGRIRDIHSNTSLWGVDYDRRPDARSTALDELHLTITGKTSLEGHIVYAYYVDREGLLKSEVIKASQGNPSEFWAVIHGLPKGTPLLLAIHPINDLFRAS